MNLPWGFTLSLALASSAVASVQNPPVVSTPPDSQPLEIRLVDAPSRRNTSSKSKYRNFKA
jgi:hypothetical protein